MRVGKKRKMKEENYGGDEEDTKRRARERSRNEDDPLTKSEGEV